VDTPATAGHASVNGVELYYEIHGDGPSLVLLHGAMGTIESCFEQLLPRLAARRRVVAVELQGHGRTPDIDRPITYEGMADDIAGLIDLLAIGPTDIAGYSMGGAVGLQVAVRHPGAVRRLAFFGGASFSPDGAYPEIMEGFEAGPPEDLTGSVWHEGYVRVAPEPDAWPDLVAKVNALDAGFAGFPPSDVAGIRAPVLLMIGDADIIRPEHAVEMFRLLGGGVPGDLVGVPPSQLAILPGTTHEGMLDQVDWLDSMIERFLVAEIGAEG
jgi:pimeloyl-ACP methyl ester carboxylesterase